MYIRVSTVITSNNIVGNEPVSPVDEITDSRTISATDGSPSSLVTRDGVRVPKSLNAFMIDGVQIKSNNLLT